MCTLTFLKACGDPSQSCVASVVSQQPRAVVVHGCGSGLLTDRQTILGEFATYITVNVDQCDHIFKNHLSWGKSKQKKKKKETIDNQTSEDHRWSLLRLIFVTTYFVAGAFQSCVLTLQ